MKNLVKISKEYLKSEGFTNKTIRISESLLRTEDIVSQLQQDEDKPTDKVPRIFHFDVPPVVGISLPRLNFLLCILPLQGVFLKYDQQTYQIIFYIHL